jgi:hypothetical protein
VRSRLIEQLQDVVIVDRVIRLPSFAAHANQSQRPKEAQLVRYGGFADANGPGEVPDAELSGPEYIEDPHAGWIAEHPKGFRHGLHVGRTHHL